MDKHKGNARICPRCGGILFQGTRCSCRQSVKGKGSRPDPINAAAYTQRGGKLV